VIFVCSYSATEGVSVPEWERGQKGEGKNESTTGGEQNEEGRRETKSIASESELGWQEQRTENAQAYILCPYNMLATATAASFLTRKFSIKQTLRRKRRSKHTNQLKESKKGAMENKTTQKKDGNKRSRPHTITHICISLFLSLFALTFILPSL